MELEMLKSAIVKVLKIDLSELDLETRFVEDLGADSLDMYQIAMNLEEIFDVSFDEADLKQVITVNDAYEMLKEFKNQFKFTFEKPDNRAFSTVWTLKEVWH